MIKIGITVCISELDVPPKGATIICFKDQNDLY